MERSLGVSKQDQDGIRDSLVTRGGLSNTKGIVSSITNTLSTFGRKFAGGIQTKKFAMWMIVVSVVLFFYLRHIQKKGPGKRELESLEKHGG